MQDFSKNFNITNEGSSDLVRSLLNGIRDEQEKCVENMEDYFTLSENLEKMTETIERTYRFLDQSDPKALANIQKAIGMS